MHTTLALDRWMLAAAVDDIEPLIARVAGGDLGALGALYDAVAPQLFAAAHWRTGSSADAADAVQDVFVKLAAAPNVLARARHPKRYLFAMAHRAALDRVRLRRADGPIEDVGFLETPERAVDAARATEALRELPPAQREAIYLHHFAGLSFRDVGRVTRVPTFTAASRYRLGMARLRALLGETR